MVLQMTEMEISAGGPQFQMQTAFTTGANDHWQTVSSLLGIKLLRKKAANTNLPPKEIAPPTVHKGKTYRPVVLAEIFAPQAAM